MIRHISLVKVMLLMASIPLTGCGASEPAQTFVGRLEGGPKGALIGLVTQGDQLVAYVCSGDGEFNRQHCRWFFGSLAGGKFDIAHDKGPRLSGARQGEKVTGALRTISGQSLTFEAALVSDAGNAGVYRIAFPTGNTMGWIVDQDSLVGGVEMKSEEGTSLGSWGLTPGVTLSEKELRGMLALTASSSPITSDEIKRVRTTQRPRP